MDTRPLANPSELPRPSALEGAPRRVALADLLELTKPGITRMIVLTTAVGLWMAPGPVAAVTAILTLLGTALIVSSANTLNCWMERDVDGLMTRTRNRPLPAGRLDSDVALWFGLGLAGISVPLLTFGVNALTGLLSALALLSYVAVYTPLKRITPLSTLVGAVPGALPALIGWSAATGRIDPPALVLFAIVFLWQMPHFLAITLFRREEYERAGFRILPSVAGEQATRMQMARYATALLPVSILLFPLGAAGPIYLVGALALGMAFLVVVAWGVFAQSGAQWARRAFFGSLIYLTALYGLMALDGLVG